MAKEKELEQGQEKEKKSKKQKPRVNISLDQATIDELERLAREHEPTAVKVSHLIYSWVWSAGKRDGLEQENEKLKNKVAKLEKKLAKLEKELGK